MATQKSNSKLLCLLLLIIVAIAAAGIYSSRHHKSNVPALPSHLKIDGTYLKSPQAITPFKLSATDDTLFSTKDLKGHWSLMFFGYTNCGFVCPTTMAALNVMYKDLQKKLPQAEMPQVIMVSVDPARDSLAKMKSYVHAFNKNFIGLRGDMAHTKTLEDQLRISAVKILPKTGKKSHYTISHSAQVMVIDPNGALRAYLSFPHQGEQMAQDFQTITHAAQVKV